jgi:hypothetical protein
MSILRALGARLPGSSLLDRLAAGAGTGGTRLSQDRAAVIAPPQPAAEDAAAHWHRTDREREIELRILMSNWM